LCPNQGKRLRLLSQLLKKFFLLGKSLILYLPHIDKKSDEIIE